MITFGDLSVGDMFNTMVARWVKTGNDMAIVVMCSCPFAFDVGEKQVFRRGQEIVLLWSSRPELMKRVTRGTIE